MTRQTYLRTFISAVFTVLLTSAVFAAPFNNPELIPPQPLIAVSMTNIPVTYQAVKSTPLYNNLANFFKDLKPEDKGGYREFLADLENLKKKIGLPLNADIFLSQQFQGVDGVLFAPKSGSEPRGYLIMYLGKQSKFPALVEAIEREVKKKSVATTPTLSVPEIVIGEVVYRNIKIKVSKEKGKKFAYFLSGDKFVLGTDEATLKALIDRMTGTGGADIRTDKRFRSAAVGLKIISPDLFVYLDYRGLIEMAANQDPNVRKSIPTIRNLLGDLRLCLAVKVSPREVIMEKFVPADAISPTSLFSKLYQPSAPVELKSLSSVPEDALLAFAAGSFDGTALYDAIYNFIVKMAELENKDSSKKPEEEIAKALSAAEEKIGFSIRNDLLASIGPEALFSLNSFKMQPLMPFIPTIGLQLVLQAKDEAKLQTVMTKLENALTAQINPSMGVQKSDTPQIKFSTIEYEGATLHSLTIPQAPIFSPCYTIHKGYFFFGLDTDTVKRALDNLKGTRLSLVKNPAYAKLRKRFPKRCNTIQFINTGSIVTLIKTVPLAMNPKLMEDPDVPFGMHLLDCFSALKALGAYSIGGKDGIYAKAILLME